MFGLNVLKPSGPRLCITRLATDSYRVFTE